MVPSLPLSTFCQFYKVTTTPPPEFGGLGIFLLEEGVSNSCGKFEGSIEDV